MMELEANVFFLEEVLKEVSLEFSCLLICFRANINFVTWYLCLLLLHKFCL